MPYNPFGEKIFSNIQSKSPPEQPDTSSLSPVPGAGLDSPVAAC